MVLNFCEKPRNRIFAFKFSRNASKQRSEFPQKVEYSRLYFHDNKFSRENIVP